MQKMIWPLVFVCTPLLAGATVWWCIHAEIHTDMRTFAAITFGGVFFLFAIIVNTANRRRLTALDDLALVQSLLFSLGQMARSHLPAHEWHATQIWMHEYVPHLKKTLQNTDSSKEESHLATLDEKSHRIMQLLELLRKNDVPSPELSRILQWHQQLCTAVEKLRTIQHHRTPLSLRVLVNIMLCIALFGIKKKIGANNTHFQAGSPSFSFVD